MDLRIAGIACSLAALLLTVSGAAAQDYAGSQACKPCHLEIFTQYTRTGHPWKLQKLTGAAPVFPRDTSAGVPEPPAGETWQSLSYVIGGYGWKARFLDREGYILTGDRRQYNLPSALHRTDGHWVAYDKESAPRRPYICGACHVTGWRASGEAGPHQDGLPGIHGTWAEPGVTCEACHGPGAAHVAKPAKIKPTTTENCRSCHIRGDVAQIDAAGGLIRHHEQYEELLASPHKSLACGTCHEPHRGTRYGQGGYKGAQAACLACHATKTPRLAAKATAACIDCHMPYAVKSAVSSMASYVGGAVPKGDLRAHMHRISIDPAWRMFTDDGAFVRIDAEEKAYLTLDYACLSCHLDRDMAWARENAGRIH